MGLGLLLVPAIGGYWFLTHCNYTRYRAARNTGYHLFFGSAVAGILLFAVSHLAITLLHHYCSLSGTHWETLFPSPHTDTVTLSVLLGFVSPYVWNFFYKAETGARKAATDDGDGIELLITDSFRDYQFVEISLRTGKVYVGLPLEPAIAVQGEADVSLLPFISGYRDKETQELVLTSYYGPVIRRALDAGEIEKADDLRVVVTLPEIVSARPFIPRVFERFRQQREADGAGDSQ